MKFDGPKISIITASLDAGEYIGDMLESIRIQTFKDKEVIVADGGSSDDTNDIVRRYGGMVDKHIIEPDNGIADAMNKGVELASGEHFFSWERMICSLMKRTNQCVSIKHSPGSSHYQHMA